MRKVPIALVFAAGTLIGMISAFGQNQSILLNGLAELSFTIFCFLVLMAAFIDLKSGPSSYIRKILAKIKAFLTEEEIYFGLKTGEFFEKFKTRIFRQKTEEFTPDQILPEKHQPDLDLVEIQKDKTHSQTNTGFNKDNNKNLSVLYIVLFTGISIWRISRMFTVVPLSFIEQYSHSPNVTPGIPAAILLLFFYCFTAIYLKMSKGTAKHPGDKASFSMLTLLAYTTLVYAIFIVVNSVLNINILIVLQWVYYAASIYIITALAINILLSIFKNNILDNFEYAIFPKFRKVDEPGSSFLDSEEVRVNFSLKSLYTFKYTLKIVPGIILSLGLILLLSTTIFVVQPHQKAALYRLGRLDHFSIIGEGLHFKLPWPIDIAEIYDVYRLNSLQIGYETFADNMNFLWDQSLFGSEYLLLLGNGNELVSVNMRVVYYISDLFSYLTTSSNPEAILSAASLEALMNRTATTTLDNFLSVDRDLFSSSILEELIAFSRAENLGLSVTQVIIESIHPPVDIAYVYQRVVSASVDKQTFITHAQADSESLLIDARRQSSVVVDNAMAEQFNRVSAARNEMAVYYAAMDAYRVNPRSFRLNQYLNTFERVIDGTKVYVFSPGTEAAISRSYSGQVMVPNLPGF